MQELLTIADTASRLGVSTATVCRMLAAGQLPRIPVGTRSVRIPASAIKSARPRATKVEKAIRSEVAKARPENLDAKIAKAERKLSKLRQRKNRLSGGFVNG